MALSLRTRGWPYHVEQTISLSDTCIYERYIQKGAFSPTRSETNLSLMLAQACTILAP